MTIGKGEHQTSDTSSTQQTPHSGEHWDEKPVREFDTSLKDAVKAGLVTGDSIPVTDNPPAHDKLKADKQRQKGLLVKIGAPFAVVAAGVGIYLSSSNNSAEKAPGVNEPVATAPATPNQSPPTVPDSNVDNSPEATPTSETSLHDEAFVGALDELSANDFNKLPLKERAEWVLTKMQEINDNGYLSDFLNQKLNDGTTLAEWSPFWMPLNKFSNGADIMKQSTYAEQLIKGAKDDISVDGNGSLNQELATKMVSGYALDPNTKAFKSMLDTVNNTTKAGRLEDRDINDVIVTQTSKGIPYTNPIDGSKTIKRNLTIVHAGQTVEMTYVFIPQAQLGEDGGLWLLLDESDL